MAEVLIIIQIEPLEEGDAWRPAMSYKD